jgi:hypothetical protein
MKNIILLLLFLFSWVVPSFGEKITFPEVMVEFNQEEGWVYQAEIYSKPLRFENWILGRGETDQIPKWYESQLAKRRADQFKTFDQFAAFYSEGVLAEAGIDEAKFYEFVAYPERLYQQWGETCVTHEIKLQNPANGDEFLLVAMYDLWVPRIPDSLKRSRGLSVTFDVYVKSRKSTGFQVFYPDPGDPVFDFWDRDILAILRRYDEDQFGKIVGLLIDAASNGN